MATSYQIPRDIERAIRTRDVQCVYYRNAMVPPSSGRRADGATIEHLDHLPPFAYRAGRIDDCLRVLLQNAAPLAVWVANWGIADTVAPLIKAYLNRE